MSTSAEHKAADQTMRGVLAQHRARRPVGERHRRQPRRVLAALPPGGRPLDDRIPADRRGQPRTGDPHLDPRHPLALGDRLGVQPQGLRRSNPQVRGLNSKTDYPERTVASPTSTQGWGHSRYRRFMAANGLAGLPSRVRGAQSVQDEGGSGRIGVTRRPGHDRTAGT